MNPDDARQEYDTGCSYDQIRPPTWREALAWARRVPRRAGVWARHLFVKRVKRPRRVWIHYSRDARRGTA